MAFAGLDLAAAVRAVTATPASVLGLADRGAVVAGAVGGPRAAHAARPRWWPRSSAAGSSTTLGGWREPLAGGTAVEVVIVEGARRGRAPGGRGHRRPGRAAARRRARPGHGLVAARRLRRPRPPLRRRRGVAGPRPGLPARRVRGLPPITPSGTGRSSPASSNGTSTSLPMRCGDPTWASTAPPCSTPARPTRRRSCRRRHRPAAPRRRRRRPHRLQRARVVAGVAHPPEDADRHDPGRQRPLLRLDRRGPPPRSDPGGRHDPRGPPPGAAGVRRGEGRGRGPGGRGAGDGDGAGVGAAAPPARDGRRGRRRRGAGSPSATTTARRGRTSPAGRDSEPHVGAGGRRSGPGRHPSSPDQGRPPPRR